MEGSEYVTLFIIGLTKHNHRPLTLKNLSVYVYQERKQPFLDNLEYNVDDIAHEEFAVLKNAG